VFVAEEDSRIAEALTSRDRILQPAASDLRMMVATPQRGSGGCCSEAVSEPRFGRPCRLHVFPWNEPAIGLYESFGFEPRRYHGAGGGEYVDAILMAYSVASRAVVPAD
jgi:hypothetical protein